MSTPDADSMHIRSMQFEKQETPIHVRLGLSLFFVYCMAGNFGGKIFWRIVESNSFGGIYFGGLASLVIMIFIAK